MSNNKQSSVDWLYDNLNKCFEKFDNGEYSYTDFVNSSKEVKQQAKAMHKEEIEKVSEDWWNEGASYMYDGQRKYNSFEQYYKEIYGDKQ